MYDSEIWQNYTYLNTVFVTAKSLCFRVFLLHANNIDIDSCLYANIFNKLYITTKWVFTSSICDGSFNSWSPECTQYHFDTKIMFTRKYLIFANICLNYYFFSYSLTFTIKNYILFLLLLLRYTYVITFEWNGK